VRCVQLQIPLAEAQVNIVQRMLERFGRLLEPEEIKTRRRLPTPAALRRRLDTVEPPSPEEGFSAVDSIPFVRRPNIAYREMGLLLGVDGVLHRSKSGAACPRDADDVEILPGRFRDAAALGGPWLHLFFVSNQSGIAAGSVTRETVDAIMRRSADLLKLPVTEIVYCPHPAEPSACWCHKPLLAWRSTSCTATGLPENTWLWSATAPAMRNSRQH